MKISVPISRVTKKYIYTELVDAGLEQSQKNLSKVLKMVKKTIITELTDMVDEEIAYIKQKES